MKQKKEKKIKIINNEVLDVNSLAQSYFSKQLFDQNSENSKFVRSYLDDRGISVEAARNNLLGYCPDGNMGSLMSFFQSNKTNKRGVINSNLLMRNDESGDWLDFFRNRLTIAILDENSNIVGFSGRALTDNSKSKYIKEES